MKRYLRIPMLCVLLFAFCFTSAFADHYDSDGWHVEFTGSEMIENFNSATINEIFSSIEPGDSATVTISLLNSSASKTMWYMHNEAINSLEQIRKSAEGGLYAYKLTYTSPIGAVNVLYDSTQIGGENADKRDPEGLNQISDKLKDYFYLDSFEAGQGGTVTLYMELDGETQGNGYQNANAAVEVQFAVEPLSTGRTTTTTLYSDRPKTADDSSAGLYAISGLLSLLLLAVGMIMKKRRSVSVLLCILLLMPMLTNIQAAADKYNYVITVYSGNVGSIDGSDVKYYSYNKGEMVDLGDVMYGGVDLKNDKYYVKGIRLAGRDNVEESLSTLYFSANQDAEYCVAYGVKGTLTSYTVEYVDASGRALLPSETLYGNVGDKPVVAFKYIDGYQPNAQNMRKTLVEDTSENRFKFTYSVIPAPVNNTTTTVVTDNTNPGTADNTGTGTGNDNANANAGAQEDANAQAEAAGNDADADQQQAEDAAEQAPQPDETPAATPAPTPAPATPAPPVPTYNPEAVATAAPVELIDLDEVDLNNGFVIGDVAVPLATLQARADKGDKAAKIAIALKYAAYALLVLLVGGLVTSLIVLTNRRRTVKTVYNVPEQNSYSYGGRQDTVYDPSSFNVDDLFNKRM